MKKKFILLPLVALMLYVLLSSYSSGPGAGGYERTGVTGTAGCYGASCHGTVANSNTVVTVQLYNGVTPVSTYIPGNAYTIRVSAVNNSSVTLATFGFQCTAVLTSTTTNAGTLSAPSGTTHTATVSGISLVEHSSPQGVTTGTGGLGSTYVVNIPWTAPAAGASVTLRGVVNEVNGSGTPDAGDAWNFNSATVAQLQSTTGTASVCIGTNTTLNNTTTGGGTWSASNTNVTLSGTTGSVATVNGVTAGTTTITYTAGGNATTTVVTVNNPSITGTALACVGATATLSGSPVGGTWSTSASGTAGVSSTGVVTGNAGGNAFITYTASGCTAVTTATINTLPTIGGTLPTCVGGTSTLSGSPGSGTWSSSATGIVDVGTSSGAATGIAAGTATITYMGTNGCSNTATTNVSAVAAISGVSPVCVGNTATFTHTVTGGTWASSNTSIATVGLSSGIVTGALAGGATISYTTPSGCYTVTPVTVNAAVGAITSNTPVCSGSTISLSSGTGGGTWSTTDATRAAISLTGVVTGGTAGTATISYKTSAGCYATAVVTVNTAAGSISGTLSACAGGSSALTDIVTGGTWSSSNTSVATIGSSSGVVSAINPGTSTITYTTPGGCAATAVFTVNAATISIGGTLAMCMGATTTLTNPTPGGTWASGNTSVATIDATTGAALGVGVGTAVVTYTLPGGCFSTAIVTVNTMPSGIAGGLAVCVGASTSLTSTPGGGTWAASNGNASILATGVATGLIAGTSTITYTLSTGCATMAVLTVNAIPSTIGGSGAVCVGSTVTLTNTTGGGTWSSSLTSVASVVSTNGVVSGISANTAVISYILSATGCYNTKVVTVNPLPVAITGNNPVCVGSSILLGDADGGGSWSSTSPSVSVGASTGFVTGLSAGFATVVYTLPTSCATSTLVTVNAVPASLTGTAAVCVGANAALVDVTTGGTWSSSNTARATVNSTGIYTGITAGTANISYSLPSGCFATTIVTVNPLPAPITGPGVVCAGLTTTLADGTSGGSWQSSNATIASVGASNGIVSGLTAGTANVSYTLGTGCALSATVTVNPQPSAGALAGASTLCVGGTTIINTTVSGGTWSSTDPTVATVSSTGLVTGIANGAVSIKYTYTNSCGTDIATHAMTVTATASAGTIFGDSLLCSGVPSFLANTSGGGTWSSSNTAVATVGSASGGIMGVSAGTTNITYTISGSCGSATTSTTITINTTPAAITGPGGVCKGATITLSDAGGGTWIGSAPTVAAISSTGVVSGIATGNVTITYTLAGGCYATKAIAVNPLPSDISGTPIICSGSTTVLNDPSTGGTWGSSNGTVASIGATSGLVSGLNAGTATISYALPTGCATSFVMTVNVTPAPIAGVPHACVGAVITLSDGTAGGSWTSSDGLVANVGSTTGVITGISNGIATISYQLSSGCMRTVVVTVDAVPAGIVGAIGSMCTGASLSLADASAGGTWSSSNTTVATIGSATGVVSGLSAGTARISYAFPTGCAATILFSVNASPSAIAGSASICTGSSSTLSSSPAGGTWSSSNGAVAGVILTSGVVVPVTLGTANISYTISNGCTSVLPVTVNAAPAAIGGSTTVCVGQSVTLTNSTPGGTWSGAPSAVAAVGATAGSVLGLSAGTTMITYMLANGCITSTMLTVNTTPSAITGTTGVLCMGVMTTLGSSPTGGTWSSSNAAIATVGPATGVATPVSPGTATISYTLSTGCRAVLLLTVSLSPSVIAGTASVCVGSVTTLSNTTGGGTWSSSSGATATVGVFTGNVFGITPGTAVIRYRLPAGCAATRVVTVNSLPFAGVVSGPASVCEGSTITLASSVSGGTWSASNGHATISADSGVVAGVSGGLDTLFYAVSNTCGSSTSPYLVVVGALPLAGIITGPAHVCVGASIVLTSLVSGGTWTVSSGDASVSVSGSITGVSAGTAIVTYTVTNLCGVSASTAMITIDPLPNPGTISGADSVCPGAVIHLTDAASGGVWVPSNTNAFVSASGDVTGVASGSVTILYVVLNSCGVDTASHVVQVKTAAQCITSVPEFGTNDELAVYPNPSAGVFTIDLPAGQTAATMQVTDVTGKIVATEAFTQTGGQVQYRLTDVAPGTYTLRVEVDGKVYRKRIVIVK
jgi:uncharacterized protein YjdB